MLEARISDAISWKESFVLWIKIHWSLFWRIPLTLSKHWFRWWIGAIDEPVHWCIYLYIISNVDWTFHSPPHKTHWSCILWGLILHTTLSQMWLISISMRLHKSWKSVPPACATSIAMLLLDTGLILGLRPANERWHYFVMTSLIGWVQA